MSENRTRFDGIEFDDDETALLLARCAEQGVPPRELIRRLTVDVLVDDAAEHGERPSRLN